MLRLLPTAALIGSNFLSFGQAVITEIKEVSPAKEIYLFPSVFVPGNAVASNKINTELVVDFLEADAKAIKKSIFENAWANHPLERLHNLDYNVIFNGKRLLTISIAALGCGAYCESFSKYYCFNIKTGNRIFPDSLLDQAGQAKLSDSIFIKKKSELTTEIDKLRKEMAEKELNKDDKEWYNDQLDLYENCLREIYKPDLRYINFYISDTDLFVSMDRCSSHANRNIDTLDSFDFVFQIRHWKKFLTKTAMELIKNSN